jgi:membrane protein DedA with SNARE-associated domain
LFPLVSAGSLALSEVIEFWPLVPTFCLLVAAGIGFPMPEELPVVGAGIWVARTAELGPLRFVALPVCILGVVISDGLLYGIGRLYGPRLLEYRWLARLLPSEKRARIEDNFHKYGVKILLFARILPGIRSPIFITAGIMKLPLKRFLLADGIYAIPGVSLLFFLAFWFTDRFQELVTKVTQERDKLLEVLILLGIASLGAYFIYHFYRKPVPTGDPKELPLIGTQVAATIERLSPHADPAPQQQPSPNGQEPGRSASPPHVADQSSKTGA